MKRFLIFLFLLACIGVVSADYIIPIESLTTSPADSQTTYLGWMPYAPNTTTLNSSTFIPATGTITKAEIYDYSGTAGTAEAYAYYVRVNDTTDYLIQSRSVSASERVFRNTSLNIAVNKGNFIQIKRVQPSWATNPLTNIVGGYLYINTTELGYTLPAHALSSTPADANSNSFGLKPIAVETTAGRNKIYIPQQGNITWAYALDWAAANKGSEENHVMYLNVSGANPGTTIASLAINSTARRNFYNDTLNRNVQTSNYIEWFRRNPTWVINPSGTTLGGLVWVNTSITSGTRGIAYPVQALTSSPTDAQVVYFGNLPKAPTTSTIISKVYLMTSGKITRSAINVYSGTAGTAENWNLSIRVGGDKSYLIENIAASAGERVFNNESLNIPISAGDFIEIEGRQPIWATNPATTIYGGHIWLEPSLPVVNFTSDITSGYAFQEVRFKDDSLYETSRNWSFRNVTGNNTEIWWSQLLNPRQMFGAGNWSIRLNSTNEQGYNMSSTPYFVNISPLPEGTVTVRFYANTTADGTMSNLTQENYYLKRVNTHGTLDSSTSLVTVAGFSYVAPYMSMDSLRRFAWSANTTSIPDDSTILDAVYSIAGEFGGVNAAGNFSVGITGFSPANPEVLSGSDYSSYGNTPYSPTFISSKDNTNWLEENGNNFTFDAFGRSQVNKTGYTSLMLRIKDDIYNTTLEMNQTQSQYSIMKGYQNDTGTWYLNPYLVVRYLPSAGGAQPVASFTISKTFVRIPNIISVTDTSTNNPESWQWSWGDGTPNSTTQNPVHQYAKRGTFTIHMTATNPGGSGAASPATVKVVGYENYY